MGSSTNASGFGTALVALAAAGAALVVALFVLASPAVSGETVLTVTKTADTNDGACTQSDCSLREAIVRANADGVDNIYVPAGTYELTITGSGEDLAATGDLDIRRGVDIRGAGARETIIDGGGIDRVFHTPDQFTSTPYTVSIFDVTVTGGAVPDSAGGGTLHAARDATLNLWYSTVRGNEANQGGGINSQGLDGSTMKITRSTVSGNKARIGGGIFNARGALALANSTVSGNSSERYGGGIELFDGTATITDSTVAFNNAKEQGGGINVNTPTTFKNTIVANNKSASSPSENNCAVSLTSYLTSAGNNLENGVSCNFDESGDKNADPKLGKLKDNGGPTDTHALLKGSPAIDAGISVEPTDQRGVIRPQGIDSDIGAYEKEQNVNVVRCPTGGSNYECVGTSASDALIGRDGTDDYIQGGEGNDAYNGKGGCDAWDDTSRTSNDHYLVSVKDSCNIGISSLSIQDNGGKKDILDLSRFYKSTDFVFSRSFTGLHLDGPGLNDIDIPNFFQTGSIDSFRFSDRTLTAKQVKAMIV